MRRSETEDVEQFRGVRKDASRTSLPAGFFQEDEGSDRYKRGTWRRRRGMRHSSLAKQTNAVTALIGMDLPGSDFSLLLVEGTNAQGFSNVAIQTDSVVTASSGYGVGLYGSAGYGA